MCAKRKEKSYEYEDIRTEGFENAFDETPSEIETEVEVKSEPLVGVVSGCIKLNVRENPSINANILGVIPENTEVMVDMEQSTHDFYKVTLSSGTEGYCMRQFIEVDF